MMHNVTQYSPALSAKVRSVFYDAVTVFVVLLFVYTGVDKLLNYSRFVFQMRLVPSPFIQSLAPTLGWAVPLAELVIVALLLIGRTRLAGLWASLGLMTIFEGYIAWMKSTGLDLPCTCGGIISRMSWEVHFIFNGVVILLLGISIHLHKYLVNKQTVYS